MLLSKFDILIYNQQQRQDVCTNYGCYQKTKIGRRLSPLKDPKCGALEFLDYTIGTKGAVSSDSTSNTLHPEAGP